MSSPTEPLRLPQQLVAARRLAAGFPVAAVARAADRAVETVEELLKDERFQRLVGGWDEIFSLSPEARTKRLLRLAHMVLEEAVGSGNMRAAFLLVALGQRQRDPVVQLAESLRRVGQREIRRAERLRASAAMPAEPAPAPAAEQPQATPRPDTRSEPTKVVDAVCWRQAARLRAAMVGEQGLMAPPPPMAGLQAEAAGLRAAGVAEPPRPAAPPPPPPPTQPTKEQKELEGLMAEEFARLPPETQAQLMTFSAADMNRLFAELMRREVLAIQAEAERVEREKGGGWPGGP